MSSENGGTYGFVLSGSALLSLGTVSPYYGLQINNSGQVTGVSPDNHAFLYTPGIGRQNILVGNGDTCYSFGINDAGQVAGGYDGGAFIYSGGTIQNLNKLMVSSSGVILQYAMAINNKGQIVCQGLSPFPLLSFRHQLQIPSAKLSAKSILSSASLAVIWKSGTEAHGRPLQAGAVPAWMPANRPW